MRTLLTIFLLALFTGASAAAFAQNKTATEDADNAEEGGEENGEDAEGAESEESTTTGESATSNIKRSNRMEFDARLIRGERASGAVFLFQRETRPLPSMVKRRTSYLDDTVRGTLGQQSAEEFREKQAEAQRRRLEAEEEEKRKARGAASTRAKSSDDAEKADEEKSKP